MSCDLNVIRCMWSEEGAVIFLKLIKQMSDFLHVFRCWSIFNHIILLLLLFCSFLMALTGELAPPAVYKLNLLYSLSSSGRRQTFIRAVLGWILVQCWALLGRNLNNNMMGDFSDVLKSVVMVTGRGWTSCWVQTMKKRRKSLHPLPLAAEMPL